MCVWVRLWAKPRLHVGELVVWALLAIAALVLLRVGVHGKVHYGAIFAATYGISRCVFRGSLLWVNRPPDWRRLLLSRGRDH